MINGAFLIFLLITSVFFIKKSNYKNDQQEVNQKETIAEINKEGNNCPYLNEQNLINKRGLCVMSLHDDR